MVLDARGRIGDTLDIRDAIAKKRSGRRVPIHAGLKAALTALHRSQLTGANIKRGSSADGPVVQSARGGAMAPNSIVNWFIAMFRALEVDGCSSHSGRRTFITCAARQVHRAGGSLRDVQILAGHRSIETTQRYIDGDTDAQRRLVSLL
jgi:integrase